MEVSQVENVKKIAQKISHPDQKKRTEMAIEINEFAKIILSQYDYERSKK